MRNPARAGNSMVAAVCAPKRKAQPMGGAAQRVAEAEPMETPHDWQRTGLANLTGRTKSEEGTGNHVMPDAGEPKARASTDPPEARRLPFQSVLR
jgi:hypothetical protein